MTETTMIREELHTFIDAIPERSLYALRPLISFLAEDTGIGEIMIETDLTDEEHAIIARGVEQYHEHPEDFVTLDSIIQRKRNNAGQCS
jgi:hypothetical protein